MNKFNPMALGVVLGVMVSTSGWASDKKAPMSATEQKKPIQKQCTGASLYLLNYFDSPSDRAPTERGAALLFKLKISPAEFQSCAGPCEDGKKYAARNSDRPSDLYLSCESSSGGGRGKPGAKR